MTKEMKQRGMSITVIANELGRYRKTIRSWIRERVPKEYHLVVTKPAKLALYKAYIRQRMEDGCLNSFVILDEIRAIWYTGGIKILCDFMSPLRP